MTGRVSDSFEGRLELAAAAVEVRLEALIAETLAAGTPERLAAAMRHALLAGGKRFRPFLVLETAAMLGGERDEAVDAAAALECVHAYSLVHDDLPAMDNDELRRGRPTVWKAFDEWTAILAGDALLTLAFDVLGNSQVRRGAAGATGDPMRQLALISGLAKAAGPVGMVGGQMLDLEADKLGLPLVPDVAHVRRLQGMKTGALIIYACEAGAITAGAGAADIEAARVYGRALGLAFQISDDLLDISGDAAVVGKAVGKDQAAGKATLVGVLGEAKARRQLDEAVATAVTALDRFGQKAHSLREAALFQVHRRK